MDLRYRTKEILRALDEGAEIVLTHRGSVKGRILPPDTPVSGTRRLVDHEAVGMWADQPESVDEMLARLRKPRTC